MSAEQPNQTEQEPAMGFELGKLMKAVWLGLTWRLAFAWAFPSGQVPGSGPLPASRARPPSLGAAPLTTPTRAVDSERTAAQRPPTTEGSTP